MKKGLSIIIPTYQVPEYLSECIFSILKQKTPFDKEILVGIDNCEITIDYIKKHKHEFYGVRFFHFNENVGPFVIKNNLSEIAQYDNLLFFDSDDFMVSDMLEKTYNEIQSFDVIKFRFVDFFNNDLNKTKGGTKIAHGIIGIKKNVFEELNGFESWICGADTEFLDRLSFKGFSTKVIDDISFFRRIHNQNLTIKSETNFKSELRKEYTRILNEKKSTRNWTNPTKLIKPFEEIILND
jgi:GT2 family glycosyltransferase